jgi:hypothetical protein
MNAFVGLLMRDSDTAGNQKRHRMGAIQGM